MLETTDEYSVCATVASGLALKSAVQTGFAHAGAIQVQFGAGGFQVRDMGNGGRIVAIEEFLPIAHA